MTKETAAVLKGSDPRPQLPLTPVQWTVDAPNLSTWTNVQFTVEESGMLSGSVTVNGQSIPITEGYISKNSKVKFYFTAPDGTKYLAKGTYHPASASATISGGMLNKNPTRADEDEERPGIGDVEDGTWSATAQGGGGDPDN